jgi:hypothetical protein
MASVYIAEAPVVLGAYPIYDAAGHRAETGTETRECLTIARLVCWGGTEGMEIRWFGAWVDWVTEMLG